MANIFIFSDPHLSHGNILKFKRADGELYRPGFSCIEEHDDFIIQEFNKIVTPADKWYCIGDWSMKASAIELVRHFNGHGRLCRGNHDIYPTKRYLFDKDGNKLFEEIYATRLLDNLLLSHYPIREDSLKPTWTNVHGHVHNSVKALHYGPKYLNVSMEVTNLRPIALEDVKKRIRDQQEYAEQFKELVNMKRSIDVMTTETVFDRFIFHGRKGTSWVDWIEKK